MCLFNVKRLSIGDRMATSKEVLVIDLSEEPENQRLLSGEPQTCGMRSGRVYLAPGQACGQHSTKGSWGIASFSCRSGRVDYRWKGAFSGKSGESLIYPKADKSRCEKYWRRTARIRLLRCSGHEWMSRKWKNAKILKKALKRAWKSV